MKLRSLCAWAVAGAALWVSMGVLDVTADSAGPIRVAMLPGLATLAAAVLLGMAAGVVAGHRLSEARRRDIFLPLYTLSVLVLPYLPWLPDALPLLRMFAGPGRYLVWLIVCTQVVWAAVGTGVGPRVVARLRSSPRVRSALIVWIASAIVFGSAALTLLPTAPYPGGDEPHYLILAQSIWSDGDLAIENNHARRDYEAYYRAGPLEPHALARGVDGELYSVHPVGLPMVIAPIMGLFGYHGVVVFLIAVAATASMLAWRWVRRLTGSVSAATFGWAVVAMGVPVVGGSGLVYPELPAALLVMLALDVGLRESEPSAGSSDRWRMALLGLLSGGLPWMSSKYALLSAALVAVGLGRTMMGQSSWSRRVATACWTALPYGLSIAAWFAFFYAVWGSPWPSAAYGGPDHTQMALSNAARGIPGLLFDQEYGLLPYVPALAVGFAGFWTMWREGGRERRLAVELAVIVSALLLTVASHAMWWGGSSLPGRFTLSVLLVLAVPAAREYRRAARFPDLRAVYRLLLLAGFAVGGIGLAAADGSLLANQRDGVARLLTWLSPDWHLWAFAPDFIAQPTHWGLAQVAVIATAILAVYAWRRLGASWPRGPADSRVGRGAAFLRANASAVTAAVLVTLLMPVALRGELKSDVDPEGRHRIALLDSFDPAARPLVIRYDPLSRMAAADLPAAFVLSARPGSRRAPQPARVLFNARFSLPAGHYQIELQARPGASLSGHLALQGGRDSVPDLDRWEVTSAPGGNWTGTFDLPADLSFVGFRSSAELPPALAELRLRPARVVPTLDRVAAYDVLATAVLGGRFVGLFYDGAAYPEESGFWVRGAAETDVSVVSRTGRIAEPVRLRMQNGPVPNTLRISTPNGRQQIDFAPGAVKEATLTPTSFDGAIHMRIGAERGFTPAKTEPGNPDRRLLAVWVDVVR